MITDNAVSRASLVSLVAALWSCAGCDPPDGGDGRSRSATEPAGAARAEAGPSSKASPIAGAISQRLSFGQARNHYVAVDATFPTGGRASIELMMAVWTPGSYLVREFSRHLEGLEAFAPGGAHLQIAKTRKNRWRIAAGGAPRVTVRYRVYSAELSVRTNWVSDDWAALNGAPTFLVPVGELGRPHDVSIELPPGWQASVTQLPPHPSGERNRYLAPCYDALVDSPILLGNPVVRAFDVGGVRHQLVELGDTGLWDTDRAARDAARIAGAQRAFWRQIPYRSYDFLTLLVDGGSSGGLEHLDSTLIVASPWSMRRRKDYAGWLGVVSHELFHAWNVKRLRPVELGPFDYENEVYTESLWLAEGVTSYYGDLLVLRAGLIDRDEYLAALSEHIREVQLAPGGAVRSVAGSSFDAWIKYYRPDENSTNSSVDYYAKGAVLGFLLDAEIRRATSGRRSLDDVMRQAYQRHAGARGYRPEDVRRAAEEVAGVDLAGFWRDFVDGVAPLDYRPALDYFGLRFTAGASDKAEGGDGDGEGHGDGDGYLGAETRSDGGKLRVSRVVRDGPAWRAGLQPGDEIIALDDRRVPPDRPGGDDRRAPGDSLAVAVSAYSSGARVTLLVSRLNLLRRIPVVLGAAPGYQLELEAASDVTEAQRAHLAAWLAPTSD